MSAHSTDFIQWFRAAAPYIHSHRGKTFVLHCNGELVSHPVFPGLVHDIALLNSLGIRVVLVYGARPRIEAALRERGFKPALVNGLRVTDSDTLEVVKQVVGSISIEIESLFSMGLPNSPMADARVRISSGNFIVARPVGVVGGVDLEFTGTVRRVHSDLIRAHLQNQELVLVPPLGYSPTGEVFNLSSLEVATEIAAGLRADKLLFLTTGPGFTDEDGRLIQHLTREETGKILQDKEISEDSRYLQLQAGLVASNHQVERVHFVDQGRDGGLMQELFSRDGVGTMLTASPYDELRRATIDDIGGILELITPLEAGGMLVRRSREKMETEIDDYLVIIRDNAVIGCAAMHMYEGESCAELACLVIDEHYRNLNKGKDLLHAVEKIARENRISKLFALTTQALHWFIEQGFKEATIDKLPVKKQELYNYQRNSKVFIKKIA